VRYYGSEKTLPVPNGTTVTRTSTGDIGVIVDFVGDFGVEVYRVKIKNATVKLRADEFLVDAGADSEWDRALGLQAVRMMLAEVKIVHPFRETLASYGATKTELHAYQFKPLMKLNRSGIGRILIADEVGLGKTIEAGYIILEHVARDPYLSVVVVCPPMLRLKWQSELRARFGLHFEVMLGAEAERRIARRDDDPDEPPLRAIVAYETIRSDRFYDALDQADPGDGALGLVIADEAHRARNHESRQSKALELLVARAQTAAFLTATPIQNKDEDLFRLLEILSPQDFPDYAGFEAQRRANAIVVTAETAVSRADSRMLDSSIKEFEEARTSYPHRFIAENPYFEDALERMRELQALLTQRPLTDHELIRRRIELQDSLFKLNLLSPILNRTRRRDVHTRTAKRSPVAVDACLTAYEQNVYAQLTNAVYTEYARQHGEGVARFVLKSFQQGFASSLWAAVSHYRNRFQVDDSEIDLAIEDIDIPNPTEGYFETRAIGDVAEFTELKRVLAAVDIDRLWEEDSKWGLLHSILSQHRSGMSPEGRPRKMLIFSYFKRSLDLIGQRLREMGMTFRRIDGSVPTNPLDPSKDERQRIICEFRDDPRIQILIASQVGTEGLDLQFCDTVVNWDLPWNPMTVEQRIGRIDRIGQKAELLHIVNIACRGTVEWEILNRLYNKIGIFRASIGDIEEILGEVAERLQGQIATTRLSESERNEKIDAEAEVLVRKQRHQQEFEQEASALITADSFLIDEFERIRRTGQCVHPHELERFTRERLQQVDPASKLVRKDPPGLFEFRAAPSLIALAENTWRKTRVSEWKSFLQRMRNRPILCTFEGEKFDGFGEVEVLSVAHPLLRVLVEGLAVHDRACHSFRCRLLSSELPVDDWVISVGLVSNPADERGARIMAAAGSCSGEAVLDSDEADVLLAAVLESGVDFYGLTLDDASLDRGRRAADRALYARFQIEQTEHRRKSELQATRRATVLTAHHDRLIEIAQRSLGTMQARALFDKGARGILAAQAGKVRAAERAKEVALAQLPQASGTRLELFEHFVGFVSVRS
jgi:superfamily II DNA or RNA helicase